MQNKKQKKTKKNQVLFVVSSLLLCPIAALSGALLFVLLLYHISLSLSSAQLSPLLSLISFRYPLMLLLPLCPLVPIPHQRYIDVDAVACSALQ